MLFTQRSFYTFYTKKLLRTGAFTHRRFYTQMLLHTDAFTHRHFHSQMLLHTDPFKHTSPDNLEIAILPQFFAIEPHFMRKGRDCK